MDKASELFNSLSFDERKRLRGILIQTQLTALRIEKRRTVAAHRKHMTDLNAHLKNIEKELEKWEEEN